MPHPLLSTKLYIPPAPPGMVRRPRLTSRLAEGLRRPLTLVSAPAGFGKTTLLSEWRASPAGSDLPLAWLSLDDQDNEPARFWTYVATALKALPAFGGAGLPAEGRQIPTALINAVRPDSPPFVLVLDDYHAIEAPEIHSAMQYLIDHAPPPMRVVILTRSDPPWPLARLRAHQRMTELRAADLRFTPAEAAEFLNELMGLELSPADLGALERRTEGWIAALHMVALSLAGQSDRRGFIAAFTGDHRYIADYLAEEVISHLPEELQRFLLQTAILDRLSAPLCDAVMGHVSSADLLDRVERANLFLVPLDGERRWYRYHHLFADLLRARLQRLTPDQVTELHLRASGWYEAQGLGMEAISHAVSARDYERAASLLEQHAEGWWALPSTTFLQLMVKMPPEVVRRRPGFCIYQAWMHIVTGQMDQAAALLRDVQPEDRAQAGFVTLMKAHIAELTGQPYDASALDVHATACIPEQHVAMRNSADVVLAYVLSMNGEIEQAATLLAAAAQRDIAHGSTNAIPLATSRLARMRLIQGRLTEAEQACTRALAHIREHGERRFFLNGHLYAVLSEVLTERGRPEAALQEARMSIQENEAWQIPHGLVFSYAAMALAQLAMGQFDAALATLDRADQIGRGRAIPTDLVSHLRSLRVRLCLAKGDVAAAAAWLKDLAPGDFSCRREPGNIALGRVWMAQGRWAEAQNLLERLSAGAADGGRFGRLIEILPMLAIASRHLGDIPGALRHLEQALALAGPEGYQNTFLSHGEPLLELLTRVREQRAYAATLLAAAGAPSPGRPGPQPLPEPLSERELEILRLLADGLSNQEIAGTLHLALGTVKTHVHNLCGKLDAQSRTQAIARARALNLL
ncbi:MAG TPA: LuxR C-terminal-related transcriptional regulator [Symbiobacteriaceae bacterium]|nr:LuxR C-terminal-related transcriptional regulator [Symbiobacteriaceae bacterium]